MKLRAATPPIILLAVAALTVAQGSDQAQIKKAYARLSAAMKSKDIAAMEALEAPDYTEEAMGQTMTRKQADSKMKQEFAALKSFQTLDIQILSLKVTGKTAIATSKYNTVATITGSDGKSHVLKAQGRTADNLVKTSSGWIFKHEKDSGSKATLDGKPVPM